VVSYVKDVHPIKSEYTFCRQLKLEKQHPEIENVHHKYKDIHPTIGNIYFADEYTLEKQTVKNIHYMHEKYTSYAMQQQKLTIQRST
jgi:hypothetical protein